MGYAALMNDGEPNSAACSLSTAVYCPLSHIEVLEDVARDLAIRGSSGAVGKACKLFELAEVMRGDGVICEAGPCPHATCAALGRLTISEQREVSANCPMCSGMEGECAAEERVAALGL
jgi:hypothetical protein